LLPGVLFADEFVANGFHLDGEHLDLFGKITPCHQRGDGDEQAEQRGLQNQRDALCELGGVDYMGYPTPMPGRFAVVYVLNCFERTDRLTVKTYLTPSLPTDGTLDDPALYLDSVTDLWAGAEWMEREVYDLFGVRFRNHPDLRRILTWEEFPAHPLRKDYPLRGRGEREQYRIVDRTSS
jgi:NADH-quinone oxidoreductase subunit C